MLNISEAIWNHMQNIFPCKHWRILKRKRRILNRTTKLIMQICMHVFCRMTNDQQQNKSWTGCLPIGKENLHQKFQLSSLNCSWETYLSLQNVSNRQTDGRTFRTWITKKAFHHSVSWYSSNYFSIVKGDFFQNRSGSISKIIIL